jgi:hypothetical protein
MTQDFKRQWQERGDLFDCPNPPHYFRIGSYIGQWRWASDRWASLSVTGSMSTYVFCACTVKTLDGFEACKIVIWRLSIMWGRTDQ